MKALELKIPPPAITIVLAAAMWVVARDTSLLQIPAGVRVPLALVVALAGIAFSVAGVVSFRRAKTTIDPKNPQLTSSLVSSGIYSVTRNPMYVGLLLALIAWAIFLWSAWAMWGPVAFYLYIGRFQIAPEERALTALFGAEYTAYLSHVRRWL
ncbi:MAG TPA: isoprenylcysteine carboxylmethyltransferase family protein [Casimicrobiaceae bacterium]|jgi:protein-S-isoprenylcysteine O-methyltransferase Ste14